MGFWGAMLLARTATPLSALRSVQALGGDPEDDEPGTDGWHLLQVHQPERDDDSALQAIADEVGGPALAAYVFDSDTAWVRLAAPRRGLLRRAPAIVGFFVDEESARNYDLPVNARAQRAAPEAVVSWAGGGDVAAVRAAISADEVYAEDSVRDLAVAIGALPPGPADQGG